MTGADALRYMAEEYKYRHLSVKLPPLRYEPPPPGLVAMLDQLAKDRLEVTAIDFDVFGCPATRVSLKPTEERSMSNDLLTAPGALLPLESEVRHEAHIAALGAENAALKQGLDHAGTVIAALKAEIADKDARIKGQTEMLTLLDRKLNHYMSQFVILTKAQPKVLEHNPFRDLPVDNRRMGPLT